MNIPIEFLAVVLTLVLALVGWELRQLALLRETVLQILYRIANIENQLGIKPPHIEKL